MTPLLRRILTSTLAQLRVAHDTGVLAVQEDIVQVFVGKVRVFQDGFDVFFREAFSSFSMSFFFFLSNYSLADDLPLSLIKVLAQ